MPLYVLFLCVTLYKIKFQNVCVGVWWLATAVLRWCGGAGPGGGPGRLVAALPLLGRTVQIVTRAFVPAVITFPKWENRRMLGFEKYYVLI